MLQDQVQTAKELLAKKPSAEFSEQLSAARQRRDEQQSKLEALLMAREIIISAIPQVYTFWSETCSIISTFIDHIVILQVICLPMNCMQVSLNVDGILLSPPTLPHLIKIMSPSPEPTVYESQSRHQ